MFRKHASIIMLSLLVASTLALAFNVQLVKSDYAWTETIYIRADGSIQPSAAPISSVDNVTYSLTDNILGNVPFNSSAILIQRDNITIDGAGHALQGIKTSDSKGIALAGRSNVTVKNMKITAFYNGIWLSSSSNNSLSGNTLANNEAGIVLAYSCSDNSLSGNNVTEDNSFGIYLGLSSTDNSVSENNVTENNGYGIYLDTSTSNNSLKGNKIIANTYGGIALYYSSNNSLSGNSFFDCGLLAGDSYGNVLTGNFVNGKPLIYLEGVSDYAVGDAGQAILVKCNNVTVENLNLSNSTVSVELWETNNSKISGNNITTNNDYGIWLDYSSYNSLSGNNIAKSGDGIELDYSSYNSVSGNNMTNNNDGIVLYDSSNNNHLVGNNIAYNFYGIFLGLSSNNNTIYHNNFLNNSRQVVFGLGSTPNVWDDGYPPGGNYWSDYKGLDQKCGPGQDHPGSDGMGDTPYVVDSNNQDNYPLMNPWTPPAGHNIAVVSVVKCKTVIFQGFSGNITVYGANKGEYPETFNVAVYANATETASMFSPLENGSTTNIIVSWNTTGFAKGNYSISAYAWPVPGETNIADNNFTDGWVVVSMFGDLTGGTPNPWGFVPDGKVDGKDIAIVAICFGSAPGSLPPYVWNCNCDVNNDGKVDGKDIALVALHYGQADP